MFGVWNFSGISVLSFYPQGNLGRSPTVLVDGLPFFPHQNPSHPSNDVGTSLGSEGPESRGLGGRVSPEDPSNLVVTVTKVRTVFVISLCLYR